MRVSTVVVTGFVVAIGCSSDVDTVDGTGGSGAGTTGVTVGPSTAGVTVSSSKSSSSSSTAQSSSSSSGGGNNCEQGCAHVLKCTGFDGCGMGGIDCNDPQYDCPFGCIADATCEEIIAIAMGGMPSPQTAACLQGCQGQGGGGGGGGGGDCQTCVFDNDCATPCINDNECLQGWGQCAQNCGDPACFDACDAMHPESAAIQQQVYDCACMACDGECGAVMDPCAQGAGGNP